MLALQASIAATTLRACEHVLRCVIEGIERDQILIRFTHVDPLNPSREFSFVLDVSAHFYKGLSALSKPDWWPTQAPAPLGRCFFPSSRASEGNPAFRETFNVNSSYKVNC